MENKQEHECARVGMMVGLLCASIAAIVPAIMMLGEFVESLPGGRFAHSGVKWPILVGSIVTLLALYLVAALLGRKAGKYICREGHGSTEAILAGIGVALSCLVVGGAVAALCIAVGDASSARVGRDISILLLIWLFGALPAILLGVLYGVLVRWRLTKIRCGKEA